MAKAKYQWRDGDISDVVDVTADELMEKFNHGFPRGTEIKGSSSSIRLKDTEVPEFIEVTTKGPYNFSQTKLHGLYVKI